MPLEFARSELLTFGVELELMVLNTRDYDLARGAADILPRLAKMKLPGEVKPEITESMIEVNSSVCKRYDDLLRELCTVRDAIVATAERLNLAVAGGGSHPFHKWHERRIYPTERFRRVSSLYGYLAKQFTVFGQHVHVGVTNGDDAVYLTHRLAEYIPHFIALSASSPYFQGEETSFETSRLHAVSAFPLSGHMPMVQTWAEFNGYFDDMKAYGIVESMKDFYWDIRPKPEYGTIEVRIFDTPLTVERAAHLAAYVQTLAAYLLRERRDEPILPMYRVYGYNRFQACRFGFEATVIDPYTREQRRLADDLLATLGRIAPDAEAMGTREAMAEIARSTRVAANGSGWLRARYGETHSLNDMVRLQAELWAEKGKKRRTTRNRSLEMDDTFLILLALAAVAIVAGAIYRTQRGKRVRAERAAYIQKYAFPAELRNRLQRNHDLSLDGSGRVLEGLRQYFLACLAAQRSPLAKQVGMPSKAVDAAWHEFIVLTKEYAAFCEKAFGSYLHHTPQAMMATPSNEALANTLHQLRGQSLTPAGWAMVGTLPLIFAIDRELGFKDGHVYDESAIHTLESQRQSMIASAASSGGGDASYAGSWGGGSDSGGVGSDGGGGGSCGGGGGGCGGGGS